MLLILLFLLVLIVLYRVQSSTGIPQVTVLQKNTFLQKNTWFTHGMFLLAFLELFWKLVWDQGEGVTTDSLCLIVG